MRKFDTDFDEKIEQKIRRKSQTENSEKTWTENLDRKL